MEIRSLAAGNLRLRNNVLLAPMAGYTDCAFRSLQLKSGAGFCFTELVSAKGLCYGGRGSKELLYCGTESDIALTGAQLFGGEAYYIRKAAESEALSGFSAIDINMGCPVPKLFNNGEGSALLQDILRAENIIKECVKSGKTVTVKIRTGIKRGDDVAAEFAKMAEQAGAAMVTVHGRTREDYYSGDPDYRAIERAVRAVKIPVIANGGIFTVQDAESMLERTGAAGVMIARGAIKNPFLVCELLKNAPPCNLKEYMAEQLKLMASEKGASRTVKEFRKFAPYYVRGGEGAKELRMRMVSAESLAELEEIIEENADTINKIRNNR